MQQDMELTKRQKYTWTFSYLDNKSSDLFFLTYYYYEMMEFKKWQT